MDPWIIATVGVYLVAAVTVLVLIRKENDHKERRNFVATAVGFVVVANVLTYVATSLSTYTPDITAKDAASVYGLSVDTDIPLLTATQGVTQEGPAFYIDVDRPFTGNGLLVARFSPEQGQVYLLELYQFDSRVELIQQNETTSPHVRFALSTPVDRNARSSVSKFGKRQVAKEGSCELAVYIVTICERASEYKTVLPEAVRERGLPEVIRMSLQHVTIVLPSELYRKVKLG